jgi:membrane protein YdbS with pleckstrin-like domain
VTPEPPENPTAELPPAPFPADGVTHRLSPQFIAFQRVAGWIFTAFVGFAALLAVFGAWLGGELPRWLNLLIGLAWIALTGGLAWFAYVWPPLEYRHTSYQLDADGIEIRSGVVWRNVTNVPRSRVQHIDVSQGPLERSYGLGRLVIFTAGTHHSRVELPGLDHAVAFALRNRLLPQGADDAV